MDGRARYVMSCYHIVIEGVGVICNLLSNYCAQPKEYLFMFGVCKYCVPRVCTNVCLNEHEKGHFVH